MDKFAVSIVLGATTGLVVAVILAICRGFLVKVILPWYENLVYHDVEIEGRWHGKANLGNREVERVWEIARQGHELTATVTSTLGFDKGQVFKMKGSFKNLILTGTYAHTDPARTDRGTYTLKLVGDGQKFEGVIAHYSVESEKVEGGTYVLFRPTAKDA